ncbi:MAG: hypothetical protein M1817_002052 [Caeruleum heppii]|nr:MAG: hypothetical protein M1817_002052 [Caeruleum heppii]
MSSTRSNGARAQTPFPTQQMFVLALCRICEPIAFMSIFPYVYYMISSFKIAKDDRQIAIYAGMVTSAFAFAEFSTGVIWGRLSDRIGRKPVLITGLAGTGLSMLIFGFAPSLPVALLGRALGGLLNGNIGVLQTTVAEMITVKEHQPRAYAIMPFVWCLGSILGPALGGALADPCGSYPSLFARGTIFDRFPYLLPNLVCAVILVCGVVIGILFLEETHEEKKHRRDLGLELGRWILRKLRCGRAPPVVFSKLDDANLDERRSLLEDEQPPGYSTREGSPRPPSSRNRAGSDRSSRRVTRPRKAPTVGKAFTKQVVLNIIGYGILAYHTISFEQLMPVFLSTPESHETPSLPFKFTGGFALSTKTIGLLMSVQGAYSMMAQLFLFPAVARRFGSLRVFRFVAMTYPLLYLVVPYVVLLPKPLQMLGIYLCLLVKVTYHVLAYPSNAILLTNSAPSMLVLGAINGIAASTASLCRAFGPTVSGLIHAAGLEMGYSGLAWWCSGAVCLVGALESLWMEDINGRLDEPGLAEEDAEACEETQSGDGALALADGNEVGLVEGPLVEMHASKTPLGPTCVEISPGSSPGTQ